MKIFDLGHPACYVYEVLLKLYFLWLSSPVGDNRTRLYLCIFCTSNIILMRTHGYKYFRFLKCFHLSWEVVVLLDTFWLKGRIQQFPGLPTTLPFKPLLNFNEGFCIFSMQSAIKWQHCSSPFSFLKNICIHLNSSWPQDSKMMCQNFQSIFLSKETTEGILLLFFSNKSQPFLFFVFCLNNKIWSKSQNLADHCRRQHLRLNVLKGSAEKAAAYKFCNAV